MTALVDQPYVVGLSGGVGSGKSTVAALLASHGAYVVDVDDISRELTARGGDAVSAIARAFPDAMKGSDIDRAALRKIVFADAAQRVRLEAILHPMIRARANAALASQPAREAPYVLLVVPLLFESNAYAQTIECAVVVNVPTETQIARVTANRNVTAEVAQGIVAAQMSRAERLKHAQFVIDNRAAKDALVPQIVRLHAVLSANAAAHRANEIEARAVV
jgi:dephospho-CoA kinase